MFQSFADELFAVDLPLYPGLARNLAIIICGIGTSSIVIRAS